MDILFLSRVQFAMTSIFHYLYVPLTIGMTIFLALIETAYYRTKNEKYKVLGKFWGKLFIINFAVGVVTGIVQEFQFGMNWSEYSRFVGDVFGGPLAIEALVAFFMESTFIGVWLWGRDVVTPKAYLVSIWLVALGTNLSAFWILVANSWMQHPMGFEIVNGKASLVDFTALLGNPYLWRQFPHVILSGYLTAMFLVLGVSAYHLLKDRKNEYFRTSFKIAVYAGFVCSVFMGGAGHVQAQHVAHSNPMKLAAAEALWETEDPAPFTLFGIFDEKNRANSMTVEIPALLSLLVYNEPKGEIKGINDLEKELIAKHGEGDYIPPVTVTFYSFKLMLMVGSVLGAISGLLLFFVARNKEVPAILLKFSVFAIILPFLGNTGGWMLTEIGRFPWLVFGEMTQAQGVTPSLTGVDMAISLIFFLGVYTFATFMEVYLIMKFAKKGIVKE